MSLLYCLTSLLWPLAAGVIWTALSWLFNQLWLYLHWLAQLESLSFSLAIDELIKLVLVSVPLLLYLFYLWPGRRWQLVAVIGIVAIFYGFRRDNTDDNWYLHVMDVGQGLAVVIETRDRYLLYDTGASYPSGFNMADAAILPYLRFRGVDTLDWLIISHDDNDHAGNSQRLRQNLQINKQLTNIKNADIPCLQGTKLIWLNLTLEVLWPADLVADHNDDSCVIKVSDGKFSVLLTGDISTKVEQFLFNELKNKRRLKALTSDVLVAPHHGSKSSSSIGFIQAVSPQWAVVSAGYLNRWHMPTAQVQARYQRANVKLYNTAEHGMVSFAFTPNGIIPKLYRRHGWPFWFAN